MKRQPVASAVLENEIESWRTTALPRLERRDLQEVTRFLGGIRLKLTRCVAWRSLTRVLTSLAPAPRGGAAWGITQVARGEGRD
jgi:hypothetical protein